MLDSSGPGGLISLVRSVEREKPLSEGKQHDDATAVLMTGRRAERPARAPERRPPGWRSLVDM
jgi:hypothetical protein